MPRQRMRIGSELRDSGRVETIENPFDGTPVREGVHFAAQEMTPTKELVLRGLGP